MAIQNMTSFFLGYMIENILHVPQFLGPGGFGYRMECQVFFVYVVRLRKKPRRVSNSSHSKN